MKIAVLTDVHGNLADSGDTRGLKRHDALDDCILIGNIFLKILQEYRERGIEHLDIRGLKVKRFQIPGMYLAE